MLAKLSSRSASSICRALLVVLLLLASAVSARADYVPPALSWMVLTSDVIVRGTIISVSERTFRVRVRRSIAGNVGRTIEVERFTDWACASRWAPYAVGQEVVLFLRADGHRYRIQSAGGEGEMPIVNGVVHVSDAWNELAPGATMASHPVYGGQLHGFRLDADELLDAVAAARRCFAPFHDDEGRYAPVRTACGITPRTPVARALFDAMPYHV
jgi:hypothetical protein